MGGPAAAVPPGAALCRWVDSAACADRLDLPWIADAHAVTLPERAAMGAVCAACPVLALCEAAADLLDATAAFWAGIHRDLPTPEVAWVPHPVTAGEAWEQGALVWPGLDGAA